MTLTLHSSLSSYTPHFILLTLYSSPYTPHLILPTLTLYSSLQVLNGEEERRAGGWVVTPTLLCCPRDGGCRGADTKRPKAAAVTHEATKAAAVTHGVVTPSVWSHGLL